MGWPRWAEFWLQMQPTKDGCRARIGSQLFNSCQAGHLKAKNLNFMVVLEKKSARFHRIHPLGIMSVWVIHLTAVEIFQTGPESWTD